MFSSLSFFRQSSGAASRTPSASAQAVPAQPVTPPAQGKGRDSVRVAVSDQARERLEAARKVAAAMQNYQRGLKEAQKDQARERVEMVKRRIEELKHLLMMFGAVGAKGLVRELKQLAGELGQAASVLKDDTGAGGAIAGMSAASEGTADGAAAGTQAEAAAGDEQARAAYAATQAMAEADAAAQQEPVAEEESSAEGQESLGSAQDTAAMERQRQTQQRRDDAESLQEAVRGLKALLAMLKSTLRSEDNDKHTQKQLKEIEQLIDDSEQAAQALNVGGGLTVDLAVSVEAGL